MARADWADLRLRLETTERRLEISERKRAFLQKRLALGSSEEDSTLWSYVDLLSLLLILFILFYSHAAVRKGSAEDTTPALQKSTVVQSALGKKPPPASDSMAPPLQAPDKIESEQEQERQDEALKQLRTQILQTVSAQDEDDLSIRWHQRRLIVTLGEKIMFRVGKANLLSDFQPTLKQIAKLIAPRRGYRVSVAGHTDNTPINNSQFPSNWELSAARAVNVAKFLILNGVDPERVSIEGHSAYRPLRANDSSLNKQSNRRVEITLFKDHQTGLDSSTFLNGGP